MFFLITIVTAVVVTAVYIAHPNPKKYKLHWLCLMLWGSSLMIFIDKLYALATEGGEFIEYTTDGLITNAAALGVAMIVPVFMIWEFAVLYDKVKGRW